MSIKLRYSGVIYCFECRKQFTTIISTKGNAQIFCSRRCKNKWLQKQPHTFSDDNINKFWSNVKVLGKNDCWIWGGAYNSYDYGRFCIWGTVYAAHRISYEIANKTTIDKDLMVCHSCDNKACVNPNHLFLGTCHDNIMDSVRKGRRNNGRRPLSKEKVQQIRALYKDGVTVKEIAQRFDIRPSHTYNIISRYSWKWIDE